ncbi:hypothetical protein NMK71_06245 [Weeksellaceae bacterium KMM 9713]|uniref:Uncharacterized protein n=1 Tax=Profundicola chukchiensis TaxID=2961959 RepID=A0A9X4MXN9_9FLAO|nr:hypothetical protein [Profundicola chukchiensis]MDG4946008.1 hypothetical protein [Profundicola chukchiensis]
MKTIISIIIATTCALTLNAQVSIDKDFTGNSSVILEFNDRREAAKTANGTQSIDGDNKTLILPVVSEIHPDSDEGTLWFDATDDKIKYKSANSVVSMTVAGINVSSPADELGVSEGLESSNAGVIVGAESSNAPGVLVLESKDKAMVLPVVDAVGEIVNPTPGSIVYDKAQKSLAVFNGIVWTFWGE